MNEVKLENIELQKEVNIYTDNYGARKCECLHECMGINAMLLPWEKMNDEQEMIL